MALPTTNTTGAPFNMALATLEAIRKTLDEVKRISAEVIYAEEVKQSIKLNLTKQLYIQSVPLLSDEDREKHKWILNLKQETIKTYRDMNGNKVYVGIRSVYQSEMDIKLDTYAADIQVDLQRQGYFMPPKSDPRYSWKQ